MFRLKYKRSFLILLAAFTSLLAVLVISPPKVLADAPVCYYDPTGTVGDEAIKDCEGLSPTYNFEEDKCYIVSGLMPGVGVAAEDCSDPRFGAKLKVDCKDENLSAANCGIIRRIRDLINVLSALVGIIAVIMLTVWGIQYTVSRDNPQMVSSARLHILQTVIAVVMYLFVYAFLQWLIPGGIL